MNIKNKFPGLIILSTILWVCIIPANSSAQGNTVVKDFNKDRSFDFLVAGMEWKDIDHWEYVLTDGKTGKRWGYTSSIDYFGSASFISIGKTRNELTPDWDPIIKAIEDTLIAVRMNPDPSLEWVLNAKVVDQISIDNLFDRVIRFEKKWYPGEPIIAENYTYRLNPVDLDVDQMNMVSDSSDTYYWYYRSHNHRKDKRTPDQLDINGQMFYKTKHALIELDEGSYTWIFMSGVGQTGGPSKLRWPSIGKVLKHGDLLFLQQSVVVGEYAFWIGDLNEDNGLAVWAKIRNKRMDGWDDLRIENEMLILSDRDGDITRISIEDINSQIQNLQESFN